MVRQPSAALALIDRNCATDGHLKRYFAHQEAQREAMAGPIPKRMSEIGGRPFAVLAGPLKNYSGKTIGTLEVALDATVEHIPS